VQDESVAVDGMGQHGDEALAVRVEANDGPALVAPRRDVIQSPRVLHPERSLPSSLSGSGCTLARPGHESQDRRPDHTRPTGDKPHYSDRLLGGLALAVSARRATIWEKSVLLYSAFGIRCSGCNCTQRDNHLGSVSNNRRQIHISQQMGPAVFLPGGYSRNPAAHSFPKPI